jgi:GH25 family lysozyme M1 (1,4-beta-N-acetylmuramidase)
MALKMDDLFDILSIMNIKKGDIMTKKVAKHMFLPIFLVLTLLCAAVFPGSAAAPAIKTQKAADAIEGGVKGIDVSRYQGQINWRSVAGDGIEFAFIRASIGNVLSGQGYVLNPDPYFEYNAQQANRYGIKVGAYHYATLGNDANTKTEAEMFLSQLRLAEITYPVVVDVESNRANLSRAELTRLVKLFADTVSREGYTVMIYSYQNFIRDNIDVKGLGDYKLWLANYVEPPKYISHSIWQYTASGRVNGIQGNVDINVAYPNFGAKLYRNTTVNRTNSNKIKEAINGHYGEDLPQSGTNGVHEAIHRALQTELNRQFDANVSVSGEMSARALQALEAINFTGSTQGNITYLLQAKLFYLGFYKAYPTGRFGDGRTSESLRDFQYAMGMNVNGALNDSTIAAIFA